jgi:hypothetical protein
VSEAVFTFDTTHMALWAEEVAGEAGIPAEVVPNPPGSGALCDLALAVQPARMDDLAGALTRAGVEFRPPRR